MSPKAISPLPFGAVNDGIGDRHSRHPSRSLAGPGRRLQFSPPGGPPSRSRREVGEPSSPRAPRWAALATGWLEPGSHADFGGVWALGSVGHSDEPAFIPGADA